MKIGIDKIGFAMPKYFLDIADLAKARNINANKYVKGLLQLEMSIAPITQDIVTLGATAASEFLTEEDKKNIDMIIIGTESGIDQSKSASIFIHSLLGLLPFTRAIEVKEACYGGTAAIAIAKNHVVSNPESSVLVITSDLAKYGIGATGESTQGAGSCAMLIKKDPSILILNDDNVYQTRDIMDFWRPNYSDFPHVDGHFSTKQYLDCLETTWNEYSKKFNKSLDNFEAICFHLPFPKIGLKGLNTIVPKQENENLKDKLNENFHTSIIYNQKVGNIYTGSLYLNLLSLLENSKSLSSSNNILMYSYGSGAVCEIFSVTLVDGFEKRLRSDRMADFDTRVKLSIEEYEKMFFEKIELDENGNSSFINDDNSLFSLEKIENHMRIYKKNNF
jgi:hydroxymethylglutaryl-coA synthase